MSRERDAWYRGLFDRHPEPMWVYDLETLGFLAVNSAALARYGYTREEMLAMSIVDIRPAEDLPRLLENVARVTDGLDEAGIWRHRKKDGTIFEVEIRSHAIDFDGRRAEVVQATDVTARRALEAQLRQAQKMEAVGRLAGGVAHDFNNLLTVILGHAELALADLGPDSSPRPALEAIVAAATRGSALTRQLLTFSRKEPTRSRALSVADVVRDVVDSMLGRALGEDIELVHTADARLPTVIMDPGQLEQVLVNLALNARDAMPKGGRMVIETRHAGLDERAAAEAGLAPGAYVRLAVSDTGHGMDAATRARVFEPFFTTKPRGQGTGLGLATAYGIIRQAGGHIRFDSEPGRGTRFEIFLPASDGPTTPRSDPARPITTRGRIAGPSRGETILVVEDDPDVLEAIRLTMVGAGYQVLPAARPEDTLRLAADHPGPLHLALIDMVLPGLGGPELARRLRELRPRLRVLFMSGHAEGGPGAHPDFVSSRCFVGKPFTPDQLVAEVQAALRGP